MSVSGTPRGSSISTPQPFRFSQDTHADGILPLVTETITLIYVTTTPPLDSTPWVIDQLHLLGFPVPAQAHNPRGRTIQWDEAKGTEIRCFDPTQSVGTDAVGDDTRVVMAAHAVPPKRKYYRAFIADTGYPFDIVQRGNVEHRRGVLLEAATKPVGLHTAGGPQVANEVAHMKLQSLREEIAPFALNSSPDVLSVGY